MTGKILILILELLFMLKGSYSFCRVVDTPVTKEECEQNTFGICGHHAKCTFTPISPCCECLPGFNRRLVLDTFNIDDWCSDTNECSWAKICGSNAYCTNTIGSYTCTCRSGYTKQSATGHNCIDKPLNHVKLSSSPSPDTNECSRDNICGSNAYCNNTIGSYTCTCHSGYTKQNATSRTCIDIDECEDGAKANEGVCGINGTCRNTNGSFWCECPTGFTNYGNERTPCSELKCDQFEGPVAASTQPYGGLAEILSQMKRSCLALARPDQYGNKTTGPTVLLNSLFDLTADVLSSNITGDSVAAVSSLLSAVEDSIKLIGPQLTENQTSMNTSQTETTITVWKKTTPPSGPLRLTNTDASLETDWSTAVGNKNYPGFALAALVSYKNLETMLNHSFEQITLPEKNNRKPSYQLFSKVVSALVSNPDTQHLDKPIILTLRHLKELKESAEVSYTCAYWKAAGGGLQGKEEEGGAWSTRGCTQVSSNASHTVCSCTHLSSFAVLMALYPVNHTFGLMLLTKLCLVVSLLCLFLCILTFMFCRSIKGTRNTINLHLCICLFLADLVFLAGISKTQPQVGCRLVAGLLHFFFLGAFSWMLLEGVHLYRMLVLVFNTTIRPRYLYTVGYGTPLVIVIISVISRPTGYGTDQYCWLTTEQGLIWSFFGPVCVVIGLNVVFFSITIWKLAQKFSSINVDLTHLHKIRVFTVGAIAQLCVLGLMWLSGVFLFKEGDLAAAYIFTILNGLQGALIFLLNCLLSKQVREEYAKLLSRVRPQTSKIRYSKPQASRSGPPTSESNL
ncbi:adhesion G protein-coupled receptor E5-like [Gadus chalcogrammus]|uniref:adhesion G protein-coupled receptor E5-like n=1 Tax=Gadus chalcogrammus TaxID=1042646 RepID=UPI0024C3EE28|nr:adhesion G protein-coupled receptor E5-like [Gadus chalcogrammus]